MILSYIAGERFSRSPGVRVYLNSLAAVNEGTRGLVTHDLPADLEREFGVLGFRIFRVPDPGRHPIRGRWIGFYRALNEIRHEADRVVLADCKDVFWQEDPFSLLPDAGLCLCSEGVTHGESAWNANDQRLYRHSLGLPTEPPWETPEYASWAVLNAGVVAGEMDYMLWLCLFMHHATMHHQANTDQAVLNNLYHTSLKLDERVAVMPPAWCATGETIKRGLTGGSWQDGRWCHPGGPYGLVHQWDRTSFANSILERWS